MPAPIPGRELILNRVEEMLRDIVKGETYHTTPKVERVLNAIDAHNEFPVLTVVESPESELNLASQKEGYENLFSFSVWGYVQATEQASRSQQLERLWQDLLTRLLKDPGIRLLPDPAQPPLVLRLEVIPGRPTDGGTWGDQGVFIQTFRCTFYEKFTVAP